MRVLIILWTKSPEFHSDRELLYMFDMSAHLFSVQLISGCFRSSTHSSNSDRRVAEKKQSLRHCKVIKLWSHVLVKPIFVGLMLHYQFRKKMYLNRNKMYELGKTSAFRKKVDTQNVIIISYFVL